MKLSLERRMAILVTTLLAAFCVLKARDAQEIVPPTPSEASFPKDLGGWESIDAPIAPDVLKVLGPGSFLSRVYYAPHRAQISLFVAYFPSQREGDAIHSPKNCLPGSGWTPLESVSTDLYLGGGNTVNANRYVVANGGGERDLVLYWYQAHGRTVASEYLAKYWLVADSIRLHRTDGALVRLITPMLPGETSVAAEHRTQRFLEPLMPVLKRYLPG